MLTLILGRCGSGKSTKLMERIRSDLAQKEELYVLVPEQFSFEAEKKLYQFLGAEAFNRLHTFSFATLSDHILQHCGDAIRTERHASEQQKLLCLFRAVRTVRERGELTILERRSESETFVQALLPLFVRFRKAGIQPQMLYDTLPLLSDQLHDKVHDLAALLYEYDRTLHTYCLYDGLVDLTEAALLANTHDFFCGKSLYFDEFDSFTGDQYAMLDVMFAQAEHVAMTLRASDTSVLHDPVYGGNHCTYAKIIQANAKYSYAETVFCHSYCRSASASLRSISSQTLQRAVSPQPYDDHVHLFSASDPTAEAEYIGATISQLLEEQPQLHCGDIAIVVKSLDDYGPLLERTLKRYGLPFDISGQKSVIHSDLVRHVLALLELLSVNTLKTEDLMRYLKTPFSNYKTVEVSMLEHYCFTWDIEDEDWLHPFCEEGDIQSQNRTREFGGMELEHTRATLITEILTLRKKCEGQTVRNVCKALYGHLKEKKYNRDEALANAGILEQREFVTLWNLICDLMDTVVSCLGEEVLPLDELYRLFCMMLRTCSFATPPQTLDSIQIEKASTALFNDPKLIFVMGVNENAFPGEIVSGGMLSQREMDELNGHHLEISRLFEELCSNEKLMSVKILSSPTEQLYLTFPERNFSGEPVRPSPIIRQILQMFPDAKELLLYEQDIPLSYYVRTYDAAYFHYVRHMREETEETASLRELLMQEPLYASRLQKLSDAGNPPKFSISANIMQTSSPLILSATKLESFYNCPFQYFCQYYLHLYVPEKMTLDSRNSGTFSHYCLEQILRRHPMEEFLQLTPGQLMDEIQILSQAFSQNSFSKAVLRDSRFQLNYRMKGRGLLDVLLHMQKEMRTSEFVPDAFEVQIGGTSSAIPPFSLLNGTITCEGKIDRVDCCNIGDATLLRVVDYKTGEKTFSLEHLAFGLDMQMLLYLFALQKNGKYAGTLPGGVLYMPSGQMKYKEYQDRSQQKQTSSEIVDSHYRMRGLLLEDAIAHVEPEIAEHCKPIAELKNEENLYVVTAGQMKKLKSHVEKKLYNMADALQKGRIAPQPLLIEKHNPCRFCGCSDLCGRTYAEIHSEEECGIHITREQALQAIFEDSEEETE